MIVTVKVYCKECYNEKYVYRTQGIYASQSYIVSTRLYVGQFVSDVNGQGDRPRKTIRPT